MSDGATEADGLEQAPVMYLGQEDEATSPRVLVQYTIYRDGDVDHRAWEAVSFNGVIDGGEGYDRDVMGFAEFPRNQPVGRFRDPEEFAEYVEAKAVYVHWKPAADSTDVTGSPFSEGSSDA